MCLKDFYIIFMFLMYEIIFVFILYWYILQCSHSNIFSLFHFRDGP